MSVCVKRAQEEFRFDPDTFADEAASFNIFAVSTISPRQTVLAKGNAHLMIYGGVRSSGELLDIAYRGYCEDRI